MTNQFNEVHGLSFHGLCTAIESYGFECEAGPLWQCADWMELKKKLQVMNEPS